MSLIKPCGSWELKFQKECNPFYFLTHPEFLRIYLLDKRLVILIFVLIKSKLIIIESAMRLFFKSMNFTLAASHDLVGSQYLISDQTGRQVLNGKLANETTPVDISQLTPGVYLIQVVGQRRSSVKMIKN